VHIAEVVRGGNTEELTWPKIISQLRSSKFGFMVSGIPAERTATRQRVNMAQHCGSMGRPSTPTHVDSTEFVATYADLTQSA